MQCEDRAHHDGADAGGPAFVGEHLRGRGAVPRSVSVPSWEHALMGSREEVRAAHRRSLHAALRERPFLSSQRPDGRARGSSGGLRVVEPGQSERCSGCVRPNDGVGFGHDRLTQSSQYCSGAPGPSGSASCTCDGHSDAASGQETGRRRRRAGTCDDLAARRTPGLLLQVVCVCRSRPRTSLAAVDPRQSGVCDAERHPWCHYVLPRWQPLQSGSLRGVRGGVARMGT